MLGRRGVGRTGAPPATIQDFCREPPRNVFKVAFEERTSRSVTIAWLSLSGGRRMSQLRGRDFIGFVDVRFPRT